MRRIKRLGIVLLAVLIGAFALAGVMSMIRGTPLEMVISEEAGGPPAIGDSLFEQMFELYTGTHIFAGNKVEQALNGDGTYPRLWQDLRNAQSTITVQMYYSLPGAVADTLSRLLRERASAGVRVLLLLDAFGSQSLKRAWADSLRAAHVEVAVLRKMRWYTMHNTV